MKAPKGVWANLRAPRWRSAHAHRSVLETIGLADLHAQRALSHGQKQWLRSACCSAGAAIELVDEPVAGMTQQKPSVRPNCSSPWRGTFGGGRRVTLTIRSIARRVTVLHEGHVLAEGDMDSVHHPRVVEVTCGPCLSSAITSSTASHTLWALSCREVAPVRAQRRRRPPPCAPSGLVATCGRIRYAGELTRAHRARPAWARLRRRARFHASRSRRTCVSVCP